MRSVGCLACGWLSLVGLVGCAPAALPVAKVTAKPSAPSARAQPVVGEKPPLTPAPLGTPEVLLELDVTQLLAGVTAGTSVRLEPELIARAWQVPAMDVTRPFTMAKGADTSAPAVFAASVASGASYELAAPDEELAARGFKLLKGGQCAVREGGESASAILCGDRGTLLAFGSALQPSSGPLAGGAMLRASMALGRSIGSDLYGWREAVPRTFDPLLPAHSALDEGPELRLAVLDVGFELAHRVVAGYEALGPLELSAGAPHAGKFTLSATLAPKADSIVARSVEAAGPARMPAAFWELSEATEAAIFFDAGLLAPWLAPSPRALGLLAKAGGAGRLAELAALPSACLQAGQGVVLATGHQAAVTAATPKPWPPELPEFGPPATPASPSFMLLGVEDPKGQCGKAIAAALDGYQRLATVAGQTDEQRYVHTLAVEKLLPKGARLLEVGSKTSRSYVGIGQRKGALWLAESADLALLKASLSDLLAPAGKRRNLRTRSELAELGKTPTLLSGFLREDALPFSDAWQSHSNRAGVLLGAPEKQDVARVPFAVVRDGRALRISSDIELGVVRRSFTKIISTAWGTPDLARLSGAKQESGLTLLDAACRLGEGSACNWLGVTYGDGRGVTKDVARALPLLERGCEQGFGMACANVAFYRKPATSEELRLFQRACELNSPLGCAWWGVRLLDQDEPGNLRAAFEKLQIGCANYVGWACARIGAHFQAGVGLAQNDEKGADFQERACQLNFGSGCAELAGAYIDGKGRPKDAARGMELLQEACKLDPAQGCYALGRAYLQGHGTAKDEAAARERFNTACEAEHAEACRALAEMAGEP
ncbi:MAG: tetratricopeptide repeat protein [Myxococcales bacterium]